MRAIEALGEGAIVAAIGDGTLAQDEFSRQSDALRDQAATLERQRLEQEQRDQALGQWHSELTGWYSENKAKLEGAGKVKPNGNPNPNPNPNPAPVIPPGVLTEDSYNERIAQERAAFLGFQRDQNQITGEHFAKFGEIVPLEPLLRHPQIANVGLLGVYELVHKERLDKWKTDQQTAHDKKIADAAVQTYRESQAQMPYPTPTGVGSGSPLDALETKGSQPVVDAAVAEYNRIQHERAAGRPT